MKFFILLLLLVFQFGCFSLFNKDPELDVEKIKFIRVKIGDLSDDFEIQSPGSITVKNKQLNSSMEFMNRVYFEPERINSNLSINFSEKKFSFKGNTYRGDAEVIPAENKKFLLINILKLEDYLLGVVPSEMPALWPIEALKAQAISARTYAIHNILYPAHRDYHLEASTYHQAYFGMTKEHARSYKAVVETRGEIILYQGKPVRTFYHSNSGGMTEEPENVWNLKMGYLKSVESPHCKEAPNFEWQEKFSIAELTEKLKPQGITEIKNIRILEKNQSGRAQTIEIDIGQDLPIAMKANEFRKLAGTTRIKSLLFEINQTEDSIIITGYGFGHGVGLSQWGSKILAEKSMRYEDIIKYYYSNVELTRLDIE